MKEIQMFRKIAFLLAASLAFASALRGTDIRRLASPSRDSASVAAIRAYLDGIRKERPTVALVLSGGGAKGAAEIGAMRVLDSLDIPVDMVLGTSIGGLIGGLYACGYTQQQMDSLIRSLNWPYLMSDYLPRRYVQASVRERENYIFSLPFSGSLKRVSNPISAFISGSIPGELVSGRNVEALLSSVTVGHQDSTSFLSLPVPFVCVATELNTGRAKIWYDGKLNTAMRSTMSIPVLFEPVREGNMVLTDGGQLDNYPVDLARECGADIVIGIDLATPGRGVNNLVDVIMYSIDVSASGRRARNIALSDVSIHPDLRGFNMMSFDSKSVRVMIDRGYAAAKEMEDTLKGIVRRIGPSGRRPAAKPIDLGTRRVRVSQVEFVGVDAAEAEFLAELIRVPDFVGKAELERCIGLLTGTGAFKTVRAEFSGREEPFTLKFMLQNASCFTQNHGLRADNEEGISVRGGLGFGDNALRGPSFRMSAVFGVNPGAEFKFRSRGLSPFAFEAGLTYKYIGYGDFRGEGAEGFASFHRGRAEIAVANAWSRFLRLRAGIRGEYFHVHRGDVYGSLFGEVSFDSFNSAVFPSSGFGAGASYAWTPLSGRSGFDSFRTLSVGASLAVSPARCLTLQPSVSLRALSGAAVPSEYSNVAGGVMPGRYLPWQLAFVGFSHARFFGDALAVGRMDLRFNIGWASHISLIYNCAAEAAELGDMFRGRGVEFSHGAALEYALNLPFAGPLRAGVCWSDICHSLGGYISFGYNF